jgi:hypothetical protein
LPGATTGMDELKVLGYCDDTILSLSDCDSLFSAMEIIRNFEKASEAKVNADKTEICPIGSFSAIDFKKYLLSLSFHK